MKSPVFSSARSTWRGIELLVFLATAACLEPQVAQAQRILGTDVSGYQPSVNWTTVKNAGVAFAWSKATEGINYQNPDFVSQEGGAKALGIRVGAYHYARPSLNPNITGANSADSEANFFWSIAGPYIKYGGAYCVPMLDWEDVHATNGYNGITYFTASYMTAWATEWLNQVSNNAYAAGIPGLKPVVYTGSWYSRPGAYPGLTTAITSWPNWISYYPYYNKTNGSGTPHPLTDPLPPSSSCYPWTTLDIWQYGDTNWSGGDADVFPGTLSQFEQKFVIGGTNAPVFISNPANVTVAPEASATFAARISGTAPLSLQWYFNGTRIAGANSTSYALANAQPGNVGSYTLVASNAYASVSSAPAYLTLLVNGAGAVPAPSGLADWWPADGTPVDIVGGKTAALNNINYVSGKQGSAFHFNGSTSYATTGASSIPVPWTACFWVFRQNALGTAAALSGDGNSELKLEQYNNTRQVGFTTFGVNDWNFGYTVPASAWTHLAFVASGTQMQLYANGVLAGTISTNIPLPRAYFGAGYVNSNGNIVDYMLGNLDEILCFNRALSAAEINAIYAAGSAGLVRAPAVTGITPLASNQFQLSLTGLTGKTFSVYRSPDLMTWTRIVTGLANPNGAAVFNDTTAPAAQSFYRISQP